MFNWICPECGRDVSPSESECRFCAERKKAAGVAVPAGEPVTTYGAPPQPLPVSEQTPQPAPQYQAPQYQAPQYQTPQPQPAPPYQPPPPQSYAPPQPQPQAYTPPPPTQQPMYAPPPTGQYYPPPPTQPHQVPYYQQQQHPYGQQEQKRSLPTWALALLFAAAFIGIIGAIFFGFQWRSARAERAGVTDPAAAARSNNPSNPMQKYIEVVGLRLVEDARHHPEARFVVVNHSAAELNDLNANVTVYASTSKSEEDAVGTFTFKVDSIGGNESKEMTEPFNTKLKPYELPDWQNANADVQLAQP